MQINCIKNGYLKLYLFTKDYYELVKKHLIFKKIIILEYLKPYDCTGAPRVV